MREFKRMVYVEWNSRLLGVAQMVVMADNFKDMFSKLESLYPEVKMNDITYFEIKELDDIIV